MSAHLPSFGGAPFSLSILRTVSRSVRSSSAFAPTTLRAMIEDEAWPSAQAFTSWAKSVTVSPSILRSTVTVEPHSLEWAVGAGVRAVQPAEPRDAPGQLQDAAVVDVVEHRNPVFPGRGELIVFGVQIDYIWRDQAGAKRLSCRLGYGPSLSG